VRVKRRVFGKENRRAPRTSIIDLRIRNHAGGFCCTAKSLSPKHSGEDSLQSKRRAKLRRGRRRRYIDVRLRLGFRLGRSRGRFFYDRGFLLLGWRICHCSFFLLATHKECGPGKDNNIFFHNVGTNV
jgi:hypothetical protein